jgi:hypothetical protein
MNGNVGDRANINRQNLRGVQITDKHGSAGFETIFPGHYMGRATHIHGKTQSLAMLQSHILKLMTFTVATHTGITKNTNNTISGGKTSHVGQIYFDQELIDQVTLTKPYRDNKMLRTGNKQDFLLAQGTGGGSDPIVEYVLLGKSLDQGIFAWINFGVDAKKKVSIRPAASCSTDGCKSASGGQFDFLFGAGGSTAGSPKTGKQGGKRGSP